MTPDQIVDGLLDREGEGKPPYLEKDDAGGRTSWGISERAHPEAWVNGPPSRDQAKAIYFAIYIKPFSSIGFYNPSLMVVLVDDAVMSGVDAAIKRLQAVLKVKIDGELGYLTIQALRLWTTQNLVQAFVVERVIRITRLVERRPSDLTNLTGWVTRILTFLPKVL